MNATGILSTIVRAASQARAQSLSLRSTAAQLRARADAERTVALVAANRIHRAPRWDHFECAALGAFVAACESRFARYIDQGCAAGGAADEASEDRRYWEALRRGLERRIARRASCRG